MSTGPGPTRKDDGSHDASVDDIADLLVEEESHPVSVKDDKALAGSLDGSLDDGLDVMLETPGPVLASTFMPPPPAPAGLAGEEGDSVEEAGAATNLAYEDLLAKLVLPAKAPEPEATLPIPSLETPLPMPEAFGAPVGRSFNDPVLPSMPRPSSSSPTLQAAPPAEEQTLVTENPLVAEEQEAAVREGRAPVSQVRVVHEDMRPALTEPVAVVNGAAKSRLMYLMFGGLLVLGGMALATIFLKLIMPTPVVQVPVVVAPAAVPQPTPVPPAQVQPLPPSPPAAAPVPAAVEPAEANGAPGADEEATAAEGEKAEARARRRETHRAARPAQAPKPAPAAKPATPAPAPKAAAPKAAPAAAAKPAKADKKGKASGYADPFDN
jgi:hypothetical protein